MKSIKFTEKEIEFLTQQYQEELADAENYIKQIKDVLKKLGVSTKTTNFEPVEKEKKQRKGRKAKAKVAKKTEPPKKLGRKPKSVPTVESAVVTKPLKEVKKKTVPKKKVAAKVKAKKVAKPIPVKKAAVKVAPIPVPTSKSIPVAASKANTRKKTEPKPVPTKIAPVKVEKKEVKKVEPKPKKIAAKAKIESAPAINKRSEVKDSHDRYANNASRKTQPPQAKIIVEKKPVAKTTSKKILEPKVAEQVKAVVDSLLTATPKKAVKKGVKKKSAQQKRIKEMAASAKLSKPMSKKSPKGKVVAETPPVAPSIVPTEQP